MTDYSIIEAMDDPDLLGGERGEFAKPCWNAWRTCLKATYGLPLSSREMQRFRSCTGRTTAPTKLQREACWIIGRRGGKSRALALIAAYQATMIDWTPYLAPGEEATVAVIASDRKQARLILKYVQGLLHGVPILEHLVEDELKETLRLRNSVTIEIHTATIASPRGRSFALVAADEIAFWDQSADAANPDIEVLAACRPGLATLADAGSLMIIASSPFAKTGVLYSTFRDNYGRDDAPVLVWRAPTWVMNPALDRKIIDDDMARDPVRFAAEYGATFRNDNEAFISREVLDAATDLGVFERARLPGVHYYAFADAASGSGADSFTLAIAHNANGKAVLDLIVERQPPFNPNIVIAQYSEICQRWGIQDVTTDAYSLGFAIDGWRQSGMLCKRSELSKTEIYSQLIPLLNTDGLRLLDNQRLHAQALGLERRTARGTGRETIDHPVGGHDDLINVAAGALLLAAIPHGMSVWKSLAHGNGFSNFANSIYRLQ